MTKRPGGVRRARGPMAGGEGLGGEEGFGVVGVLEVGFEGEEGMADGGEFMRICIIY